MQHIGALIGTVLLAIKPDKANCCNFSYTSARCAFY